MLSPDDKKSCSILIVDDEPKNIQLLGNILKEEQYQVEFATNGEEALEWNRSQTFSIILLDIMMPDMDGFEVCTRIKSNPETSQIPIIFITAKAESESIVKGFEYGASDYVTKPFNKSELLSRVETRLELDLDKSKLRQAMDRLQKKHQELKETQAQLVQTEKMAGLGTLVAGVAHEINNPVNFLQSGSTNLKHRLENLQSFIYQLGGDDMPESVRKELEDRFDPLHKNLEAIGDGVNRIREIVQNLRVFSRIEEDEQKSASVVEGLQSTLALVKANYKDNVAFACNFEQDPEIRCWPSQLNQVFMNILVNACQSIQEKAEQISAFKQGQLEISTVVQGQTLQVLFQDNGCGMTEDTKKKIFDPFFTTKEVGLGTGLGMSIAFGIIENHKGRIRVYSTPGEGSTITIELPI